MFDAALVLAFAAATTASPAAPPVQSLPSIAVRAPRAMLQLQVASTEEQRERGLMNVVRLAPGHGMLFVFDDDARVVFWMKDTLLSLDMIFLDPAGKVRAVAPCVPVVAPDAPDEQIPRRSGIAKFVIELAAGEAKRDGIVPGTTLFGVTAKPH